jgi:hypothetical protein
MGGIHLIPRDESKFGIPKGAIKSILLLLSSASWALAPFGRALRVTGAPTTGSPELWLF